VVSVGVGGAEVTVGPEDFLLVPRGTAHTFGNAAGREA
jgi:mannose-6-phosphate isomerase-like protein (cupin superfamily)